MKKNGQVRTEQASNETVAKKFLEVAFIKSRQIYIYMNNFCVYCQEVNPHYVNE